MSYLVPEEDVEVLKGAFVSESETDDEPAVTGVTESEVVEVRADGGSEPVRCDGCGVETESPARYEFGGFGVPAWSACYCGACEKYRRDREIRAGDHEQYRLRAEPGVDA